MYLVLALLKVALVNFTLNEYDDDDDALCWSTASVMSFVCQQRVQQTTRSF